MKFVVAAALTLMFVCHAQASMTLQSVGDALVNQPNKINDYTGTTPDGNYMDCGAGVSIQNGLLVASLSYGDTGAAVRGSLGQVASATRSGDLSNIKWASDEFPETEVTLEVKNKTVVAMSITTHERILFIPHDSTIRCENLEQFVPKTIR